MIEQVKDYQILDKIVIVDNASKDDSKEKLKYLESDKIKLILARDNKGYAYGNNLGLKYLEKETDCTFAIISNPDIEVEESVIQELVNDLKNNPDISFIGPKVLEFGSISKGWKLPSYASELLSTMNYFHKFGKKMLRYEESYYQDKITPVEVIHGCFFVARLKDFKKLGYFDENTFLYYEENILGKKAKEQKKTIALDTSVGVIHALSKSVDKSLNKIKKYKILKQSMFYYETTYNHMRGLKLGLLKCFYYISLGISYLTFWI